MPMPNFLSIVSLLDLVFVFIFVAQNLHTHSILYKNNASQNNTYFFKHLMISFHYWLCGNVSLICAWWELM